MACYNSCFVVAACILKESKSTAYIFILHTYLRYYLERSNSAKLTLKRARELFPLEVRLSYPK